MNKDDIFPVLEQANAAGRNELLGSEISRLPLPVSFSPEEMRPAYETVPAVELSFNLRSTREFGMVISCGPGGPDAELYRQGLRPELGIVTAATGMIDGPGFFTLFQKTLVWKLIERRIPEGKRDTVAGRLSDCFNSLVELANICSPADPDTDFIIDEFAGDLLVTPDGEITGTDCLCRFREKPAIPEAKPIQKINNLLHPESIGIIGVSGTKMNFGRIILKNILASGYDRNRLTIIKPGDGEIDGVKCVESLASLDHKLDLFVVAVGAEVVFQLVDEIIETNAARSVMLIPGGLGETAASRDAATVMMEKINQAHNTENGGPVFLGGNCLGVVSHPGNYDTWFIPRDKLPRTPKQKNRNTVLLSQSGAFMITRLSQNPWLDPAYMIAVGNQNDLTHGDMLNYFADKDGIDVIGVYAEGFRDLDGLSFARGIHRAVSHGKQVIVYKAGHTQAGQTAALSHTASIAGDYPLFETIIARAGAIIAGEISEFNDLVYTAMCLHGKKINGNRLAAVSGAGFETVGMADSILHDNGSLEMARIEESTRKRLAEILVSKKLDALMEVRNPFDINPGADDEAHALCTRAFAEDPNVDSVVVGLDPLSPMMRTLQQSSRPGFDIHDNGSIVNLLAELSSGIDKPVIGIIDGGSLYDPMAEKMMDLGVCIFRSCDRGVRALAKYTRARLQTL